MIRYRLKHGVEIWLEAADPNESAVIQVSGQSDIASRAYSRLRQQYGAFGHTISRSTTPIDLDAAMRSPGMREFSPELVEGQELVKSYSQDIPAGGVT